jgi:hypothetical protein
MLLNAQRSLAFPINSARVRQKLKFRPQFTSAGLRQAKGVVIHDFVASMKSAVYSMVFMKVGLVNDESAGRSSPSYKQAALTSDASQSFSSLNRP